MTIPARSATSVTGTKFTSVPEKSRAVIVTSAAITMNSTGAHQMGSFLPRRGLLVSFHCRHPDRWKLPDCPYTDSVMVNTTTWLR